MSDVLTTKEDLKAYLELATERVMETSPSVHVLWKIVRGTLQELGDAIIEQEQRLCILQQGCGAVRDFASDLNVGIELAVQQLTQLLVPMEGRLRRLERFANGYSGVTDKEESV